MLMPFGRYIGKPIAQVPAAYLLWLFNQGCRHAAVKRYILDNLTALKSEISKQR